MVATSLKAADAARIKNNVVRGLGAACGGRADLLRAIPSEDDHVFSKTPGETTKTPGDTLALEQVLEPPPPQPTLRVISSRWCIIRVPTARSPNC